jgi:K+-sensing histidine kinase KdpD
MEGMTTHHSHAELRKLFIVIGPGAAVLVAWLLTLPTAGRDSGVTVANVALLLAVLTVGCSLVYSAAGVTTSISAALALNFFHIPPYRTLRITDRADVYSVLLLATLGVVLGSVTELRAQRRVTVLRRSNAIAQGETLAELLTSQQPVDNVWAEAITSAVNDLGILSVRVVRQLPRQLATIGRRVDRDNDHSLFIPVAGASLALMEEHAEGSWLIFAPRDDLGPVTVDRRALLSFADTVERTLLDGRAPALEPVRSG